MEAIKTPDDMSDKTTIKFEQTKTMVAKEIGYDDWETCINDQSNYMVEQVMDKVVESYAEQHLEDVLGESNGLAQYALKNNWVYNYSSGKWMQLQESQNYISLTTEELAKKALNLLKQRTNGS